MHADLGFEFGIQVEVVLWCPGGRVPVSTCNLRLLRSRRRVNLTKTQGAAETDPVEVAPQVVRPEDARNLDELVFVARAVEQGVTVEDLWARRRSTQSQSCRLLWAQSAKP